jgi:anti-sigma factor RsiW
MDADDKQLSELIKGHATRHAAPESLRAGLRAQLAVADASRRPVDARGQRIPLWSRFWGNAALRGGSLGFALGVLCMALALPVAQDLVRNESLDADLVTSHVRAMKMGPLLEVASTDRHTVKPWFQGRLDFAPPVIDLDDSGFPLKGGRIEHVRGNVVAALVYASDLHVIDLYVWPSNDTAAPATLTRRGFSVVSWAEGSMQYWAVSDLERAKLERFAQAWRQRLGGQ